MLPRLAPGWSVPRTLLVALSSMLITIGSAQAHGGMAGPDELGPPIGISVTIGLACYFAITLWPSRHREASRKNGRTSSRAAR